MFFAFIVSSFHNCSFEGRHWHTTSCYTKVQEEPHKTTSFISTRWPQTKKNWNKALNSWELGVNHVNVCVCISIKTLYMQSKESHYINTNNTHQIHQKSNTHIIVSDIQQKHTIQEVYNKICNTYWERNRNHTFTWRLVKGEREYGGYKDLCVNTVI